MSNLPLKTFMEEYQHRIRSCLDNALAPSNKIPADLLAAMRYCVLGGGKRIRALLAYATGLALNVELTIIDQIAVAIELVHAYSLIHDDLPSMDNADLRHGKTTCHKQFNEAIATLTGDALQSLAFETLAQPQPLISLLNQIILIQLLAHAIGPSGMAGGQALDLAAESKQINLHQLESIHQLKTGALIVASVKMAAITANCTSSQLDIFTNFAQHIGLAFQIQDDVLDQISSTETLGKDHGADEKNHKMTYVTLLGLKTAQEYAEKHYQLALENLKQLPFDTTFLRFLAEYIVKRNY